MKPFWITLGAGWLAVMAVIYSAENRLNALHQQIYQPRALTPDEVWVRPAGYLDEYELRLRQLAQDTRPLDTLIFGNSRAFKVSSDLFKPGATVRNLSVGGVQLRVLTALWQACLQQGRHPGLVLIFLDPAMFRSTNAPSTPRGTPFPETPQAASFWVQLYQLRNLLSWDGLRVGIQAWARRHPSDSKPLLMRRTDWHQEGIAYTFDGSLLQSPAVLTRRTIIINALETLEHSPDGLGFESFSPQGEDLKLFRNWLSQIRAQGGQAYVVLPPYHPVVYRRLQELHPTAVQRFSSSIENAAGENHAAFCNALNPALSACGAMNFRDEIHADPACIGRVVSRCLSK